MVEEGGEKEEGGERRRKEGRGDEGRKGGGGEGWRCEERKGKGRGGKDVSGFADGKQRKHVTGVSKRKETCLESNSLTLHALTGS